MSGDGGSPSLTDAPRFPRRHSSGARPTQRLTSLGVCVELRGCRSDRSLKIDLANIAGTPGARGRYSISEEVPPTDDVVPIGPVEGELEVENIGSLLLVRGVLHARVRLTCVRCLASFELPVEMEVEEEFATEITEPDVPTMDRDEPEASAMSDFILDVSELIRQQLLVNVPMAAICREGCRGICPVCGQNLNEETCTCAAQPVDSRWAKLADLAEPRPEKDKD